MYSRLMITEQNTNIINVLIFSLGFTTLFFLVKYSYFFYYLVLELWNSIIVDVKFKIIIEISFNSWYWTFQIL